MAKMKARVRVTVWLDLDDEAPVTKHTPVAERPPIAEYRREYAEHEAEVLEARADCARSAEQAAADAFADFPDAEILVEEVCER